MAVKPECASKASLVLSMYLECYDVYRRLTTEDPAAGLKFRVGGFYINIDSMRDRWKVIDEAKHKELTAQVKELEGRLPEERIIPGTERTEAVSIAEELMDKFENILYETIAECGCKR